MLPCSRHQLFGLPACDPRQSDGLGWGRVGCREGRWKNPTTTPAGDVSMGAPADFSDNTDGATTAYLSPCLIHWSWSYVRVRGLRRGLTPCWRSSLLRSR